MQLEYPWFLAGLGAIVIPVIIHLLNLRRPQRILFTNTSFVREVDVTTFKYRRVQNLLLLLIRVVCIVALVMAFCQPFISDLGIGVSGRSGGINVLVDNSFSMQRRGISEGKVFESALAQARGLAVGNVGINDFKLLNTGNNSVSRNLYLDKLDGLAIGAQQLLSRTEIRGNDARDLYVFSDFQRNTVDSEVIDRISGQGKVILVPIGGKPVANVYVDSVWLDDAFVRPRTNVGLHVVLRNGGALAARDVPVKVFLGNRQVGAFRADIAPGQGKAHMLQVQVQDAALVLGRVVTEDAAVAFDNTFYFTLQPAGVIKILEIGEEPITKRLYANEPLFAYSFSKAGNVNYARLREADLVVVREVKEIEAGLRDGLRAVLKRGGNVVVVPGSEPVGHSSYQLLFTDLGLGKVEWEQKTVDPELREVAMPNAREPFFGNVFGAQQRAVTMPRVAPVLRWARTGADILRLRDGDSYLAKFASGAGHVYVFSAPFAQEYSDFVAHALFVPVMYRMAMLSYRNEQSPAYRLSRKSVALQLGRQAGGTLDGNRQGDEVGFRFEKDSLMLIPPQRAVGQEVQLELPEGMDQAGFYKVKRGARIITTLAFNQSKQESELACYSADELRALIGPNRPNVQVLDGGVDGAGLASYRAEQAGTPLWRYFVALALVCLLAEALVVRFGAWRKPGAKLSAA